MTSLFGPPSAPPSTLFRGASGLTDLQELSDALEEMRRTMRALPPGRPRDELVAQAAEHALALGLAEEAPGGGMDERELRERAFDLRARAREVFGDLVARPLADLVGRRYGCTARFVHTEHVEQPLPPRWARWRGPVHAFALDGHPTSPLAYAWVRGEAGAAGVATALHEGPVKSARLAVLADALGR